MNLLNRCNSIHKMRCFVVGARTILSQAYLCEESWNKRLESPLLKNLKMDLYFVETDKKFNKKELASGVDIDLFANNVQNESELDELEHLLYRFRVTKRSPEIMDSTTYAVIKIFLKFRQYESLFRILNDRENYGIFPDMYSYNILMDAFLKEKHFREAAQIAILMMLQEDFSNKISCLLGLYSCQMFLNEHSVDSLYPKEEEAAEEVENNEDEEEVTLVRVPFLENPWNDDHFDLFDPKHLMGKTFYLIGRELNDVIGRTYQLLGLAMYEKWDKALKLLTSLSNSNTAPVFLSEGVEKFKKELNGIADEQTKEKWLNEFEIPLQKLLDENKIEEGDIMTTLNLKLKDIGNLERADIEAQKKLFLKWENDRIEALKKQHEELDKQRRLKVIEEKKEYLYWKEKLLFFFENEDKVLEEHKKVEELVASLKSKIEASEDTYVPPEILKRPQKPLSIYERLARVKKL